MAEMTCYHCLEEYPWTEGMWDETCPACREAGHCKHWGVGKCEVCNAEYFAAMARIKGSKDFRTSLIEVIEKHFVASVKVRDRCPMCQQPAPARDKLCKECRDSCNKGLYELITSRTDALKSRPKCVTPLNNEAT